MIFSSIGYLVAKPRGRLLAGSTMEEAGFVKEVTVGGVRGILDAARRIVPDLATAPITDLWSGLRPATLDSKPVLGPGPVPGLTFATGHGRKGVLHAPLTAAVVTDVVTGAEPLAWISRPSPTRVSRREARRAPRAPAHSSSGSRKHAGLQACCPAASTTSTRT